MTQRECRQLRDVAKRGSKTAEGLAMLDLAMDALFNLVYGSEDFSAAEELLNQWLPEPAFQEPETASQEALKIDDAAWRCGFEAGESGASGSSACPYRDTVRIKLWVNGCVEGSYKAEGLPYSEAPCAELEAAHA